MCAQLSIFSCEAFLGISQNVNGSCGDLEDNILISRLCGPCAVYEFLLNLQIRYLCSCRRPIFTISTSTYHFCKLSLVKVPCSAHGMQSGSSGSNSYTEPHRVLSGENAGSRDVNPAGATEEYEQGNVRPFQNPITFKGSTSLLIVIYALINHWLSMEVPASR
jgi:hypothetical protein